MNKKHRATSQTAQTEEADTKIGDVYGEKMSRIARPTPSQQGEILHLSAQLARLLRREQENPFYSYGHNLRPASVEHGAHPAGISSTRTCTSVLADCRRALMLRK